MLEMSNEFAWKRFLEQHPKLKELAVEAGVENDPKRAQELNSAYALNCRDGVVKSEAERKFARYMFCRQFESEETN